MNPDVTAIIVNWNRKNDVIALLDTVSRLNHLSPWVVVVDNASTDDSVSAIKGHPLDIILIENKTNLGGTGGFNTGIRYALNNLKQDYIWLIDNDAMVDPDALAALVYAMEQDPSIAIAGSKILNSHDPTYIVESGAYLKWRTASVLPVSRNILNNDNSPIVIDVDYVAICSALLRVSAVDKIGLMDERYFLLWDDMDWGITFKGAGYRVVAVNNSIIYHPPFTEKRSLATDNYYGIRNPLLTASKRACGLDRCWAVLTLCRRATRIYYLAGLDGQSYAKRLIMQAIVDFVFNRWGKLLTQPEYIAEISDISTTVLPWSHVQNGRVLVLNSGSSSQINEVLRLSEARFDETITVDIVVQADRKDLISVGKSGKLFLVDFETKNSLIRNFKMFLRLRTNKYLLAINPSSDRTSPFAYVALQIARFDPTTCNLLVQKRHSFLTVFLSVVCSELMALVLLPVILLRAYFYGRSA